MAIADQIRDDILAGRYAPGAVLPQTELAACYGVSRIPIRDALQSLAAEKLVEILPGKGAQVTALTDDEITEIYDLRASLECDLLARAIARADAAAHGEAEYALRKSSLEAGRPGWQAGDWSFHQTLYLPAGRPRQTAIVGELRMSCALYASQYEGLAVHAARWIEDHTAIFEAYVAGRTADACARLHDHIMAARGRLGAD
jgi:DNA-binding GntR family transcriptional regulator